MQLVNVLNGYQKWLICCLLCFAQSGFAIDEQWFHDNLLQSHNCKNAIMAELAQWQTQHQWRRYAKNRFSDDIYRSPTQRIGYWIEVQRRQHGQIKILRVTPEQIDTLKFNSRCEVAKKTVKRNLDQQKMAVAFTDLDLENFIDSNPEGGLILAWSPNMPLSQQMIVNTRKVAEKNNIPLVLVVDPHADEALVDKVVAENNLVNASRKIESLELIFQGMTTHYPSLLSIKDKRISSPVVPGVVIEPLVKQFVNEHIMELKNTVSDDNADQYNIYWMALLVLLVVIVAGTVGVARREKSA